MILWFDLEVQVVSLGVTPAAALEDWSGRGRFGARGQCWLGVQSVSTTPPFLRRTACAVWEYVTASLCGGKPPALPKASSRVGTAFVLILFCWLDKSQGQPRVKVRGNSWWEEWQRICVPFNLREKHGALLFLIGSLSFIFIISSLMFYLFSSFFSFLVKFHSLPSHCSEDSSFFSFDANLLFHSVDPSSALLVLVGLYVFLVLC